MKALITGATSGIGMSIAKNLRKRGWELILTGRNEKVLKHMQKVFGGTEIITADLSVKSDVFRVYDFCKDKNIDMLVNNAGYGIFGRFDETNLNDEIDMINVNITAVHILMKLFLRDFRYRNYGIILNVASLAGFLTGPLMSSYYASKNYVVRLSIAVAEELRREKSDVKITVLCPGPVSTNFNSRAGVTFSVKPLSADYVADYAVRKALSGQLIAVPGLMMKAGVALSGFVPHR
ncbi:MAG: SDR family NAD(P)-dependent oxidoreductase, partial [Ruminococcus sp.]|nr:SDR family NAD(P)-dependent oxidoreductase [Ruminococcus sp.]